MPASKAPWSIDRRYSTIPDPELLIRDADGRVIADVSYSANPLTNWTVSDVEEMRANAKLLAAAPELLDLLRRIVKCYYDVDSTSLLASDVREALESLK